MVSTHIEIVITMRSRDDIYRTRNWYVHFVVDMFRSDVHSQFYYIL